MPPATMMSASPAVDHLVGQIDRVESRQAYLVDVDRRHAHRDPGLDGCLAAGNLPLPGHQHLAHDHVVDLVGSDSGAFECGLDGSAAEISGGQGRKAPLIFPIGVRAPATMYEPAIGARYSRQPALPKAGTSAASSVAQAAATTSISTSQSCSSVATTIAVVGTSRPPSAATRATALASAYSTSRR